MGNELGDRIQLARKKCKLSLRKLSEAMGGKISHETIRQIENGTKTNLDTVTLIGICQALQVSMTYLLSPQKIMLGNIDFRKKSTTSAGERAAIRTELLEYLERYLQIEDILGVGQIWEQPELRSRSEFNSDESYVEGLSLALREKWDLGCEPIRDLTDLLEEKGIKVLFSKVGISISGLTCEVKRPSREPVYTVVVNAQHGLERRRSTMTHELAHRILDLREIETKKAESLCNRFAGALLIPKSTLYREMGSQRRSVALREIMIVKKFFRVSAAMLVMRLEQVGILNLSQRDWIFRSSGKTWRSREPEPIEDVRENNDESQKLYGREIPQRFERLVFRALSNDLISVGKASEFLRISVDKVEKGLRG